MADYLLGEAEAYINAPAGGASAEPTGQGSETRGELSRGGEARRSETRGEESSGVATKALVALASSYASARRTLMGFIALVLLVCACVLIGVGGAGLAGKQQILFTVILAGGVLAALIGLGVSGYVLASGWRLLGALRSWKKLLTAPARPGIATVITVGSVVRIVGALAAATLGVMVVLERLAVFEPTFLISEKELSAVESATRWVGGGILLVAGLAAIVGMLVALTGVRSASAPAAGARPEPQEAPGPQFAPATRGPYDQFPQGGGPSGDRPARAAGDFGNNFSSTRAPAQPAHALAGGEIGWPQTVPAVPPPPPADTVPGSVQGGTQASAPGNAQASAPSNPGFAMVDELAQTRKATYVHGIAPQPDRQPEPVPEPQPEPVPEPQPEPVPEPQPEPVPAPKPHLIAYMSDGQTISQCGLVLVGRAPMAAAGEEGSQLITVADSSVSKTHLGVRIAAEGVWAIDRASTNGSQLLRDGQRYRLNPWQDAPVLAGDEVLIGGVTLTFRQP